MCWELPVVPPGCGTGIAGTAGGADTGGFVSGTDETGETPGGSAGTLGGAATVGSTVMLGGGNVGLAVAAERACPCWAAGADHRRVGRLRRRPPQGWSIAAGLVAAGRLRRGGKQPASGLHAFCWRGVVRSG